MRSLGSRTPCPAPSAAAGCAASTVATRRPQCREPANRAQHAAVANPSAAVRSRLDAAKPAHGRMVRPPRAFTGASAGRRAARRASSSPATMPWTPAMRVVQRLRRPTGWNCARLSAHAPRRRARERRAGTEPSRARPSAGSTARPSAQRSPPRHAAEPGFLGSAQDEATTFHTRGHGVRGDARGAPSFGRARTSANTVSRITNDRRVAGRAEPLRQGREATRPDRGGRAPRRPRRRSRRRRPRRTSGTSTTSHPTVRRDLTPLVDRSVQTLRIFRGNVFDATTTRPSL